MPNGAPRRPPGAGSRPLFTQYACPDMHLGWISPAQVARLARSPRDPVQAALLAGAPARRLHVFVARSPHGDSIALLGVSAAMDLLEVAPGEGLGGRDHAALLENVSRVWAAARSAAAAFRPGWQPPTDAPVSAGPPRLRRSLDDLDDAELSMTEDELAARLQAHLSRRRAARAG